MFEQQAADGKSQPIAAQPGARERSGRIIARNTAFGLGAQFTLKVVGFLFNVYVINTLGGEQFGRYSIVLAWVSIFAFIGDLGIVQYLAREVARDRSKLIELFWDTVALRIVMATAASIITVVAGVAYGYSTEIVIGIALYTAGYFFQVIYAPLISVLTGNEHLDYVSVLNVVMQVLYMASVAVFLLLGLNWLWLLVPQFYVMPIMISLELIAIRRHQLGPGRFRVSPRAWWALIRGGLPFGAIQLALSLTFRVDTVFLSAYVPDEAVGWYNTAYRLTQTLHLFGAFNAAIVPTLAHDYARNPESVRPWYYMTVRVLLTLGLPIAIGGALLGDQIIGFLYPGLFPAALAFAILIWDVPLVTYTSFAASMAMAIRQEKASATIIVFVGVVNVVLNAVLIPPLGLVGACFATVLTDAVGLVLFYLLFRTRMGSGLQFFKSLRVVIAALGMGLLLLVMRNAGLGLFVTLPVTGVLYLIAVWFSGAYSRDERTRLIEMVGRRLRPQT